MQRSRQRKVTTIQGSQSYTTDCLEFHQLLDSIIKDNTMETVTERCESILESANQIEKQINGLISEPRKKTILNEINKIRRLVQEVIGQME